MLGPLKSRQYEVGVKTEQARWSATAALFRIERGAEYTNSQNVYVQDGQSIYQGLELAGTTRLGTQWELGGSLMVLDSWYAKGSAYDGNRVAGAPRVVAAARLGYACLSCRGCASASTASSRAAPGCARPTTCRCRAIWCSISARATPRACPATT